LRLTSAKIMGKQRKQCT